MVCNEFVAEILHFTSSDILGFLRAKLVSLCFNNLKLITNFLIKYELVHIILISIEKPNQLLVSLEF